MLIYHRLAMVLASLPPLAVVPVYQGIVPVRVISNAA